MQEKKKNAYDMLMEFPRELSLCDRESSGTDEAPLVKSVIGTQDLEIAVDAYARYETSALLLEVRPEAAALLAEISRVRGQEYEDVRETSGRLPIALKIADASQFGIRAMLVSEDTCESTELCMEHDKALRLREAEVEACGSFQLEVDYDGTVSLTGEEPYNTSIKVFLTTPMLQQMAAWQPEESAGMSPS